MLQVESMTYQSVQKETDAMASEQQATKHQQEVHHIGS
jgi:hypothetical protein